MKPTQVQETWMGLALQSAREQPGGDIPIGALVIGPAGEVLAVANNTRRGGNDPTAHAEIVALRAAGSELGTWRLDECTLVVTLEPCPMCAGAAVAARVSRIVFGAWNPDYGACGSVFDIPRDPRVHHRAEVVAGVRAEECQALVRTFFTNAREAVERA